MSTFAELYCAQNGCALHEFKRKVFWRTLHWTGVPLAPLLLLGDYFASDLGLIHACGCADRMQQIYEEIDDHIAFPSQNSGWLRRCARVRISTRRLRKLAECFLPNRARLRELQNAVDNRITPEKPVRKDQLRVRPIFRAAALQCFAPSTQITQMVHEGFLKPLRSSIQP